MRGGSIVDATIIAAPSSTKNASGTRDPEMHQTKKGNQWYFGMKGHIGVDAGTGYVHSVTATAANVTTWTRSPTWSDPMTRWSRRRRLPRSRETAGRRHERGPVRHRVEDRGPQGRVAGHARAGPGHRLCPGRVRAKVEHPFLIVKRDFGFTKTRYRGLAKNLNHLNMLFASANWLMRGRAPRP